MSIPFVIKYYQSTIVDRIFELVHRSNNAVSDTIKYQFGFLSEALSPIPPSELNMGKLIRPTLVLMACEAAGGDVERVLTLAAGIELIHTASLIHDDLEDLDQLRRHRPTVWKHFGKSQSIISGNFAIKLAHTVVNEIEQHGLDSYRSKHLWLKMTEAHLRMVEGQYADIAFEQAMNTTEENYFKMIALKTGALLEFSLYAGALAGPTDNVDLELCRNMMELGRCWGMLFQIQDDIIGAWGNTSSGKPVGGDLKRKKKALPLIHLIHKTPEAISKRAIQLIARKTINKSAMDEILQLMEQAGTQDWCQSQANKWYQRADALIQKMELGEPAKTQFNELGNFLISRSN